MIGTNVSSLKQYMTILIVGQVMTNDNNKKTLNSLRLSDAQIHQWQIGHPETKFHEKIFMYSEFIHESALENVYSSLLASMIKLTVT